MDTWYDEKYKFYHCATYCDLHKSSETNWNSHDFVSKNRRGELLGYISYSISQNDDRVFGLSAINFTNDKLTFGKDLVLSVKNIFEKFNYRKLSFTVIIGNPIERSYDRMVKKYGGRILGVQQEHVKLNDNRYYDQKLYEILREDYLKAIG